MNSCNRVSTPTETGTDTDTERVTMNVNGLDDEWVTTHHCNLLRIVLGQCE